MKNLFKSLVFVLLSQQLPAQCNQDKTPPVLSSTGSLQVTLDNNTCLAKVSPMQLLQSATDNCTPVNNLDLRLRKAGTGWGFPTVGSLNPGELEFSSQDVGAPVILEVWAMDGSKNTVYTFSSVTVLNPSGCNTQILPATICAATPSGNPVSEITWQLENVAVDPVTSWFQNDNCQFLDSDLLDGPNAGFSYRLTPGKDINPLNGVSTFDIVLLFKQLLNTGLFTNPYQFLAADADRNGSLTLDDALELRKLILGIYTELPNNTSWRFVPADYIFPYPNNPFWSNIPESVDFDLNRSTPLPDFIALKVGDINGTASVNNLIGADDRSDIQLHLPDRVIAAGETARIPVRLQGTESYAGLQLALRIDPSTARIRTPEAGALPGFSSENYFEPTAGHMNLSWVNPVMKAFPMAEPLFYLNIEALKTVRLSDILTLEASGLAPEAYSLSGAKERLSLQFDPLSPAVSETEIMAIRPNPGMGDRTISCRLAVDTQVETEIFNPNGQLIYSDTRLLSTGANEIRIPAEAFGGQSGVFIYRVKAGDVSTQGRVVVSP